MKKKALRSSFVLKLSSKLWSILSINMDYIKDNQCRMPQNPLQESNRPTTLTQAKPTQLKRSLHTGQAILQKSIRWSTYSPLLLHMQYKSITTICLFLILFMVRIFPKVAVPANKNSQWDMSSPYTHLEWKYYKELYTKMVSVVRPLNGLLHWLLRMDFFILVLSQLQ